MSQYEQETRPIDRDDYQGGQGPYQGQPYGQGYYGPPQQQPPYWGQGGHGYGYGPPWGRRWGGGMHNEMPIETKPFFLTSEFWAPVILLVGLAIAAASNEGIDDRLFWTLATVITSVYVLSRGIAKSGTKSRSWDPREEGMQRLRDRVSDSGSRD